MDCVKSAVCAPGGVTATTTAAARRVDGAFTSNVVVSVVLTDNYESGVLFDTCTKAVMAHVSTDGIKEKVRTSSPPPPTRNP